MFPDHNAAVADILKQFDGVTAEQLESIIREQERSGKALAELAIESGLVSRERLLEAVAAYLEWPYEKELPVEVADILKNTVESKMAHMYGVVPYLEDGYELKLLAIDPFNNSVIEDLSFALNRDITLIVGDPHLPWPGAGRRSFRHLLVLPPSRILQERLRKSSRRVLSASLHR